MNVSQKFLLLIFFLFSQLTGWSQTAIIGSGYGDWIYFPLTPSGPIPWSINDFPVPSTHNGWNTDFIPPGTGWRSDYRWASPAPPATGMWANENSLGQVHGALFRQNFYLPSVSGNYSITIFVDDYAELFINGIQIGGIFNIANGFVTMCIPRSILKEGDNLVALKVTEFSNNTTRFVFELVHDTPEHRLYVDEFATGLNNGLTWTDAFNELQDALTTIKLGGCYDEIWVSTGTYYPDPSDPTVAFELLPHVKIYGGFNVAAGHTTMPSRNWHTNPTNLELAGGTGYYVIRNSIYTPLIERDALLDGFRITNQTFVQLLGCGAMHFDTDHSPTIRNCVFDNNSSAYGAALYMYDSSPLFENCWFSNNQALGEPGGAGFGGAVYSNSNSSEFVNCVFTSNISEGYGGAVNALYSKDTYTNCTFTQNQCLNGVGGAVCSIESGGYIDGEITGMSFRNSIFYDNYCDLDPTFKNIYATGAGLFFLPVFENCDIVDDEPSAPYSYLSQITLDKGVYFNVMNMDPLFTSMSDLELTSSSPCRELGINAYVADYPYDYYGRNPFARIDYCNVDLGAREYHSGENCPESERLAAENKVPLNEQMNVADSKAGNNLSVFPNPADHHIQIQGLDPAQPVSVEIVDYTGKVIVPYTTYNNQLDISGLEGGLYIIHVKQSDEVKSIKLFRK